MADESSFGNFSTLSILDIAYYEDSDEEEQIALTDDEIRKIPLTTEVPEDEKCCICLEEFEGPARTLPCNHHYHDVCITPWLTMHNTCPFCRYQLEGGRRVVADDDDDDDDTVFLDSSSDFSLADYEEDQEGDDDIIDLHNEMELSELNDQNVSQSDVPRWCEICQDFQCTDDNSHEIVMTDDYEETEVPYPVGYYEINNSGEEFCSANDLMCHGASSSTHNTQPQNFLSSREENVDEFNNEDYEMEVFGSNDQNVSSFHQTVSKPNLEENRSENGTFLSMGFLAVDQPMIVSEVPVAVEDHSIIVWSPVVETPNAAYVEVHEIEHFQFVMPSVICDNYFYTDYSTPPSLNTRSARRNGLD